MGWKSTKEISRKELEQKIEHEINYNDSRISNFYSGNYFIAASFQHNTIIKRKL